MDAFEQQDATCDIRDSLKGFDPGCKADIAPVVKRDLVPLFQAMDTSQRAALDNALNEISEAAPYHILRFWGSLLPPFDLPAGKHLLFTWIREILRELQTSESLNSGKQVPDAKADSTEYPG
jgi:hypothetical protein